MLMRPLVAARNSTAMADGFWHVVEGTFQPASPAAAPAPTPGGGAGNSSAAASEPGSTAAAAAASTSAASVSVAGAPRRSSRVVSTVSTTTTQCMVPDEGDDCYKEVIDTMYTIQSQPTATHGGLNMWSSFEEVQDVLHGLSVANRSNSTCRRSCACEVAHAGSDCHASVAYIVNQGVREHPEWYPGLGEASAPEEFQGYLSRSVAEANCARPCKAASWRGDPSLFCWSLAQGSGYEQDVMRAQLHLAAGIFGCDGFAVASEDAWSLGRGPGGRIGEVRTVRFKGAEVGVSKDGTAGNAQLFMLAWNAILTRTAVLSFDWAVK
ncbi:unnamed protein product, partial [Prorocentrum cordatum]